VSVIDRDRLDAVPGRPSFAFEDVDPNPIDVGPDIRELVMTLQRSGEVDRLEPGIALDAAGQLLEPDRALLRLAVVLEACVADADKVPGDGVDQSAQARLDVRRIVLGGFRQREGIRRRLVELDSRDRVIGNLRRIA
jgi:hypothetical protein